MLIQLLGAIVLAFLASLAFGKVLIQWLKKHDIVQPLKDEVQQQVYTEENSARDEKAYK